MERMSTAEHARTVKVLRGLRGKPLKVRDFIEGMIAAGASDRGRVSRLFLTLRRHKIVTVMPQPDGRTKYRFYWLDEKALGAWEPHYLTDRPKLKSAKALNRTWAKAQQPLVPGNLAAEVATLVRAELQRARTPRTFTWLALREADLLRLSSAQLLRLMMDERGMIYAGNGLGKGVVLMTTYHTTLHGPWAELAVKPLAQVRAHDYAEATKLLAQTALSAPGEEAP